MTASAPLLRMIDVDRLRGGRAVVRGLNLELAAGQVLGLLGVNGAGKSTTLAMLAGALRPSRGRIWLDGVDAVEQPEILRRRLGWLPEQAPCWPELTVAEHVATHARLRGLRGPPAASACERALERVQLDDLARRQARKLSLGQRQRLGLACAIVHDPAVLVLDEPGNGLDPLQTTRLRELIHEHAAAGGAVLLSTHVLGEVRAVCERVAILHHGRLCHEAPVDAKLEQTFMHLVTRAEPA